MKRDFIQESKNYIVKTCDYIIDESTFMLIDKNQCKWIAEVTTTHEREQYNRNEETFAILVTGNSFEIIYHEHYQILMHWFADRRGAKE